MQLPTETGAYHRPSDVELAQLFAQKYGRITEVGWSPRQRHQFGYYLPADVYEALLTRVIVPGCHWLDVGGGHHIFPENAGLSRTLADRAATVVAVDPSDNVLQNPYVHERVQAMIEDYQTERTFDVATLRMVAEHVAEPERMVQALHRLLRPSGVVVIFTVYNLSPLTLVSRALPFRWHHPIKKLFWGGEEEDTFPVEYKMNSRSELRRLFETNGFREASFSYLDDLSTLGQFRIGSRLELWAWRLLRALRLRYPESCLLGVYQKARKNPVENP
jgi:2-polyprenyl-3-methyl-5-hydroxy-6-metoxy-1,4-benzoquinol methylase